MGLSSRETPLAGENEGYVALPGSSSATATKSQAALGSSPKWRRCGVVVATSCIAAVLLLSWALVSYENVARTDVASDRVTASRTSFHFQPEKNFQGDPCAPMFYKGYYHFFYQYNPHGVFWNTTSWGHTVSTDLIHWKYLDVALSPDQWYDDFGTWTGSATILPDGSPIIIYTGGRNAWGGGANQTQNVAVPVDPSDPLLREWKKIDSNPVIYNPDFVLSTQFRDPSTAWLEADGLWRLTLGSRDAADTGLVMIYTSTDFVHWKVDLDAPFLNSVPHTGIWECSDLYPVFVEGRSQLNHSFLGAQLYHDSYKYVLKISVIDRWQDHYAIGSYSTKTHTFTSDDVSKQIGLGTPLYDYGVFYGSKTFFDTSTGRRILWGYANESQIEEDRFIQGWACVQAIPRTIWLDGATSENLLVWPVEEVEALRGAKTSQENIELQPTDVKKVAGGDGPQLDILVVFEKPDVSSLDDVMPELTEFNCTHRGSADRGVIGPFGLLVHSDQDLKEQTAVFFYASRSQDGSWKTRACTDQSRSSLSPNQYKAGYGSNFTVLPTEKELSLRILVDHSIVESFVQGGRIAITTRVYPTIALGPKSHVFLFNNGTTPIRVKSVDVYKMDTIKITSI